MALITCYECGASISNLAAACPHCGAPAKEAAISPEADAGAAPVLSAAPLSAPVSQTSHVTISKPDKQRSAMLWKRAITCAVVGAILSIFIAHPPLNHHDPLDRVAHRLIALFAGGFLGGVAAIIFSWFQGASSQAAVPAAPVDPAGEWESRVDDQAPLLRTYPNIWKDAKAMAADSRFEGEAAHEEALETANSEPAKSNAELMEEFKISFDGEHYRFENYRYSNLQDAANYAKRMKDDHASPPMRQFVESSQEQGQPEAFVTDAGLMTKFGISFDGEFYHFKNYRYSNFQDAVNYAKLNKHKY